jgi:hypothetical protein
MIARLKFKDTKRSRRAKRWVEVLVEISRKRIAKPVWPLPSSHANVEGQANSIKTAERRGKRAGFAQTVA